MPLGTTCLDVFSHTNLVRASYKGLKPYDTDGTDWGVFADQYVLFDLSPATSVSELLVSHDDKFSVCILECERFLESWTS